MNTKKCTWSQHPKWFIERRADPANKDLTDLDIWMQYYFDGGELEDIKPLILQKEDEIWQACWQNLLVNSPRIEGLMECMNECVLDNTATIEERTNNNIRPSNFIVKVDDKYCEWEFGFSIGAPSSIENLIVAIESAFSTERNYQKITRHAR